MKQKNYEVFLEKHGRPLAGFMFMMIGTSVMYQSVMYGCNYITDICLPMPFMQHVAIVIGIFIISVGGILVFRLEEILKTT